MNNNSDTLNEPSEAFPYTPPSADIKLKYKHIFAISNRLPSRFVKTVFDKTLKIIKK